MTSGTTANLCTTSPLTKLLEVKPAHEFVTSGRIVAEASKHSARHHFRPMFVYATRRHTSMGRFDDNTDPFRLQDLLYDVRNLCRQPFLNLQPTGKRIDDTSQF
jgi:hypothetical protein